MKKALFYMQYPFLLMLKKNREKDSANSYAYSVVALSAMMYSIPTGLAILLGVSALGYNYRTIHPSFMVGVYVFYYVFFVFSKDEVVEYVERSRLYSYRENYWIPRVAVYFLVLLCFVFLVVLVV